MPRLPSYESLSLVGDKHAVILDIGSAYTKCGFGSEFSPRAIIPSCVDDWETGMSGPLVDYTRPPDQQFLFFTKFLHQVYYKHLLVVPKERRVVIVESVLCPSEYRDLLARVLFTHFDVPSVLFSPSHLLSTFTLGTPNALVVDVGYRETLVLPVFESVAMLNCWEASPNAARAVHKHLESLLVAECKVRTGTGEVPLAECPEVLTESVLEDIKARLCFVTHMDRGRLIQRGRGEEGATPPTPPPDVLYPLEGDKEMIIPGRVREEGMEVMFEREDDDKSIPQLILDSLLRCPIDLRKVLGERIMVVGGGCMIPGFMARLKDELHDLVKEKYSTKLPLKTFKFFTPPSKENFNSWLGGSVFGALEILPHRSVSRDDFLKTPTIPDWTSRIGESTGVDSNGTTPER